MNTKRNAKILTIIQLRFLAVFLALTAVQVFSSHRSFSAFVITIIIRLVLLTFLLYPILTLLKEYFKEQKKTEGLFTQKKQEVSDQNKALLNILEDLRESNEELKLSSSVRSEFASIVSHELRTPLACIKEGINIVLRGLDGPISDDQRKTLGITKKSADRLARLIDDVLDYSRLETGKINVTFEKNDLKKIMAEVYEFMKLEVDKTTIIFEMELEKEACETVCDSDKVKQIIINLIHNALKFTPARGKITMRLLRQATGFQIQVEDSGSGIPKEDQEKIFELFKQGNQKDFRRIGGFGIGLAVCRMIADLHRGHISVKSEFGCGSTFTFFLPSSLTLPISS